MALMYFDCGNYTIYKKLIIGKHGVDIAQRMAKNNQRPRSLEGRDRNM